MKKLIIKSLTNGGLKAKQYVIFFENAIIIRKFILYPKGYDFRTIKGGEVIVKETENYFISYHWYSIKIDSLNLIFDELNK